MPVNSTSREYDDHIAMWEKCRDCLAGEDAIKRGGEKYLPMLTGQDGVEYAAYKNRALFFGATDRTVKGLVGTCLRKDPEVIVPTAFEPILATIGPADESFKQVSRMVLEDTVGIGRVGVLTDITSDGIPYFSLFTAESIINWKVDRSKGYEQLKWVVLKEKVETDTGDIFKPECDEVFRLLWLGQTGTIYTVSTYKIGKGQNNQEAIVQIDEVVPKGRGGRTLDYIPFTIINATGIRAACEKSPILDLVNVNISYYRNSADLEHGRHFTALPTACVSGFDPKTQKLRIGSSEAWIMEDTAAKAWFLEFSGAGLKHLADALADKRAEMAILGARLLDSEKNGVEAADAIRLRHSGEKSVLATIVQSASQGMTQCLKHACDLAGMPTDEVMVKLNEDFGTIGVPPAVLTAVMSAYQVGAYSYDALFWFLKNNDLLPPERTKDEELAFLAAGPPMPLPPQGSSERSQESGGNRTGNSGAEGGQELDDEEDQDE